MEDGRDPTSAESVASMLLNTGDWLCSDLLLFEVDEVYMNVHDSEQQKLCVATYVEVVASPHNTRPTLRSMHTRIMLPVLTFISTMDEQVEM